MKFLFDLQKLEILMGVDPEYALREDKTNKMWTASRIHQFPSGGGFMSSHVDTVLTLI